MPDVGERKTPKPATPKPKSTSFPDGKMTVKEAWNFCREACEAFGAPAPTLRTFRWHLKHGNHLKSEMLPDPFEQGSRNLIPALTEESVLAFVETLKGETLKAIPVPVPVPFPTPPTRLPPPTAPPDTSAETQAPKKVRRARLSVPRALAYLRRKVTPHDGPNSTTFGFYLAYELIPSEGVGENRKVAPEDLDAFVELAPDGVYANHLVYETDMDPNRGDLAMAEAYEYYAEVDPAPISLNTFRALVAAGIIVPLRTANGPRAPVIGFRRQEINAFLALRQRLAEKHGTLKSPEPKPNIVAKMMEEALQRAKPKLDAAKRQDKETTKPASSERWVNIREAYEYFSAKTSSPRSHAWFRAKVYEGTHFATRSEKVPRNESPTGKLCKVNLNSLDEYLKSFSKDEAEEPKKAVKKPKTEAIPKKSAKKEKDLSLAEAYAYYCSRCPEPVSKSQISRYALNGAFPAVRKSGSHWVFTKSVIDKFLEDYPSGRFTAKESAVPETKPPVPTKKKSVSSKVSTQAKAPAPVKNSETKSSTTLEESAAPKRVVVSIKNYKTSTEMKKAMDLLHSLGFEIEVTP